MAIKLPLKYFGRVIGTATIDENGDIKAHVNMKLIPKGEQERLFGGAYSAFSFSLDNLERRT